MEKNFANKLSDFLQPTNFCDFQDDKIANLADKITAGCQTDRDKAIACFNYVKNGYKYAFGNWRMRASEFAGKKSGMCTLKSNLLVALLRHFNIPAGFRVVRINAQDVFQVFTKIDYLHEKMSKNSVHIFANVYLDNHWIDIDPSLDEKLVKGLIKINYGKNLNKNWDGIHDYVNFIPKRKIISDLGLFSNIDEYHEKKRRAAKLIFTLLSNLNIEYYRIIGNFFYNI
ncbi:MAG: transglutaminase family protein [Patescibacteria group bacterium]|nr:transglutaminase family protein [Patescibacteria group bacterium]MDD4611218.1 transglutaminase family protein [Patescibacteria group bacterium]